MKKNNQFYKENGFTLIELIIAMAIGSVVMISVYKTYQYQIKSFVTQQGIVDMQQNIRSAMHLMIKEIRMAGCDPTGKADAAITNADATSLSFTMDITGGELNDFDDDEDGEKDNDESYDGDTSDYGETITYQLSGGQILRNAGGGLGNEIVAENIDALNFVYLGEDGTPVTNPDEIRSVQISIVARVRDSGFRIRRRNNNTYKNQRGNGIFNAAGDDFQRFFLTSEVKVRNAGLN